MSAKHTPGPWAVGFRAYDVTASGGQIKICDIRGWGYLTGKGSLGLPHDQAEAIQAANARLIAAAPDHALIGWALCVGGARWAAWGDDGSGEFCIGGLRHSTKLDEFGVPVMTDGMRAAIAKAKGDPA